MDALLSKSNFIGLDDIVWLYSGAETPPYSGGMDAVQQYMLNRRQGPIGRELNSAVEQSLRDNLAQLLHGTSEQIALMSNASEAICSVALGLPLQAGDNVVIHELEFPSGVLPWLTLREKGIEVRVVPHQDWNVSAEQLLQHVDQRTKLVFTSHVSYMSGGRLDYKKLYAQLKQTDTLLFLDATQSLGAIDVDVRHTDLLVCSSYKWLLSVHGLGILALNPDRTSHLLSNSVGWRSVSDLFSETRFERYELYKDARRFELGYPSYPSIYAMNASTAALLDVGVERIEHHITQLSGRLIEGLQAKGYSIMTPRDPNERAGNISIRCPDGEGMAGRLCEQGVYLWGGDGRIRASVHLFNDSEDIDRLIALMPHAEASS